MKNKFQKVVRWREGYIPYAWLLFLTIVSGFFITNFMIYADDMWEDSVSPYLSLTSIVAVIILIFLFFFFLWVLGNLLEFREVYWVKSPKEEKKNV